MPTLFLPATVRRFAVVTLFVLGACVLSVRTGHGQQPADSGLSGPHLLTLMPCGGKVGSTVEVAFTGIAPEDAEQLLFNHPGIKAEPMQPAAPAAPADPKKPAPPMPPPQVSKFKVTIGADVPPGLYDARLVNK